MGFLLTKRFVSLDLPALGAPTMPTLSDFWSSSRTTRFTSPSSSPSSSRAILSNAMAWASACLSIFHKGSRSCSWIVAASSSPFTKPGDSATLEAAFFFASESSSSALMVCSRWWCWGSEIPKTARSCNRIGELKIVLGDDDRDGRTTRERVEYLLTSLKIACIPPRCNGIQKKQRVIDRSIIRVYLSRRTGRERARGETVACCERGGCGLGF